MQNSGQKTGISFNVKFIGSLPLCEYPNFEEFWLHQQKLDNQYCILQTISRLFLNSHLFTLFVLWKQQYLWPPSSPFVLSHCLWSWLLSENHLSIFWKFFFSELFNIQISDFRLFHIQFLWFLSGSKYGSEGPRGSRQIFLMILVSISLIFRFSKH